MTTASQSLPYCTLDFNDPVMRLTFKEEAELDIPEVREMIVQTRKFTKGKPYLLFSDVRGTVSITPEGRKVAADIRECPLLVANAVLVNSLSMKLIANFFNRFNKPHFKLRVFTDEKKAMQWLLKHPLGK